MLQSKFLMTCDVKERNSSKMESGMFKIPIEIYEKDMNTESLKENKEKIIDLFMNHNNLVYETDFIKVKTKLHRACRECDLDLIKILLCETIVDDSKRIFYKIDKTNKTASLFQVDGYGNSITIPRTVKHESTDYLITSISKCHYSVEYIEFAEDSAIDTIYRGAFVNSKISELNIPASLKKLKTGWCDFVFYLNKITISPLNDHFVLKDGKCLLGKSEENSNEFDVLLFVCRDAVEISIPSTIKIISSYSFLYCQKLTKINIPTDSNLQTIEPYAFKCTTFKEIYFPSKLKELKKGWCCETSGLTEITISPLNDHFVFKDGKYLLGKSEENSNEFDVLLFAIPKIIEVSIPSNIKIISSYAFSKHHLKKVEIPKNSNLQVIESYAFERTSIREIFIPSKVTKICKYAFDDCCSLSKVEFQADSNLQIIEKHAFKSSCIKELFIPSKVTKICKYAFAKCYYLEKVEIPTNSNLQIIEKKAFESTNLFEIYFPASLKKVEGDSLNFIKNLSKITISPLNDHFIIKDNKYLLGKSEDNDEFDIFVFSYRNIKEISIPSSVKFISSHTFFYNQDLTKFEIPKNSNLQRIESNAFERTSIREIFIPSTVSKICAYAFWACYKLAKVEIPKNSNLKIIESRAFESTSIREIFIPSKVTKIGTGAFLSDKLLQKVEFSIDSNLQTIEPSAFRSTGIKSVWIPPNVSKIDQMAFEYCSELRIVEFSEGSKLKIFKYDALPNNKKLIVMIPPSLRKLIPPSLRKLIHTQKCLTKRDMVANIESF